MTWLLSLIAPWLRWLYLGAALAVFGALGAQTWRLHSAQTTLATERLAWVTERALAASAAASASEAARTEEKRRVEAQTEIANESQRFVARAQSDGVLAAAAADRLRQRASAAFDRPAPSNPTVASGSAPTAGAGLVFSDLLGSVSEAARRLADLADRRGIAGQACERAYGALTVKP